MKRVAGGALAGLGATLVVEHASGLIHERRREQSPHHLPGGAGAPAAVASVRGAGADAVHGVSPGPVRAEPSGEQPRRYVAEVCDRVARPSCLAEKPKAPAVTVTRDGAAVHPRRCPCCVETFEDDPETLLGRLAA